MTITAPPALKSRTQTAIMLGLITMIGLLVRLVHVATVDFPLNDGGFFYLMTRELQTNAFSLPTYTTYNHAGIPFAYPPLGLYLAGSLVSIAGWSLLDVIRIFPALIGTVAVPIMYALGRVFAKYEYRSSSSADVFGLIAAFTVAVSPAAADILIEGGGLTRAPGYVAGLFTCLQAFLLWHDGRRRWLVGTIIGMSLTVLGHFGAAWFTSVSIVLLWAFFGRTRRGLRDLILVGLGTACVTAPWWLGIVLQHGLLPFAAAAQTPRYYSILELVLTWRWSLEPWMPVLALVGLLGLFRCINDRRWFLPSWVLAALIVNGRAVPTFALWPLALLTGVGVLTVIIPGLGQRGAIAMLSWGAIYLIVAAVLTVYARPLMLGEREAMWWAKQETALNSRFVLITPDPLGHDPALEWFPALSERVSVATTQGYEWMVGAGADRIARYTALQQCRDVACVEQWVRSAHDSITHVYLDARTEPTLRSAFATAPNYRLVYSNFDVAIYARHAP